MFITFEGGDGVGKTTQIGLLKEYLEKKGYDVVNTREPGGVTSAEIIRNVIFDNNIDPVTEALLYASARREHLVKKVLPSLNEGKIVICDRFVDSSIAYQGVARCLGVDVVEGINSYAIGDMKPDLTILFKMNPCIALERIYSERSDNLNRLDKEDLDFHLRVEEGFDIVRAKYPDRVRVIDASKSIDEVAFQIASIVDEFL